MSNDLIQILKNAFNKDSVLANGVRRHIREDTRRGRIASNLDLARYVVSQDGMDAEAEFGDAEKILDFLKRLA